MSDTAAFSDLEILAKTIWGEARGEPLEGQKAIACVVLNRLNSGIRWWGTDARSICLTPYQFSCWLKSDPNRPKLMAATPETDPIYAQCLSVSAAAMAGALADNTRGADSYKRIGSPAKWALALSPVITIGKHEFYITITPRLIAPLPSAV